MNLFNAGERKLSLPAFIVEEITREQTEKCVPNRVRPATELRR
jgi:hypothetical protein